MPGYLKCSFLAALICVSISSMKPRQNLDRELLLDLGRSYQPAAILAAAADLELFDLLEGEGLSAGQLARKLRCEARGLAILLDAMSALKLVRKKGEFYTLPPGAADFLTARGDRSILAMAQHQANCMRNWAQLARVVKSGQPAEKLPSVRGSQKDEAAFIGAMHNVSAPNAAQVTSCLSKFQFKHLLDVGGASGTWTAALLRSRPAAKATLFDLPHVLPMARRLFSAAGLLRRVTLVPGDFTVDPLPGGADFAWVSAIIHQNSREQNRVLFGKVFDALAPGSAIAIRDVLVDQARTSPAAGALFAVHMLVSTTGGGTFTFNELRDDLRHAGFIRPTVLRRDTGMNSIVVARKPQLGKSHLTS
jgi:predicted O-methyltransferase YrrM